MALTRAFLKSLGLDEDKVTSIIEAHTETINGLTTAKTQLEQQLAEAKKDGETLKTVQKELDDLKKEDYKTKYETEKKAHEDLVASNAAKEAKTAKETAVKAFYESKNIKGANLAIAMRGTSLDGIELDDKGAIKDTKTLEDLVAGDFKPLTNAAGPRVVGSGASVGGGSDGGAGKNTGYNLRNALHDAYDNK